MGPTCALLCLALLLSGCGRSTHGTDPEVKGGWARLVQPSDGDSVGGRIELVAEVDLGELVHRVTFFANDAPIVVATQTPWATDWIPPTAHAGQVVHFRVEATGASQRVTSPDVAVWIAPRGTGSRIVGPSRSVWVERTPHNFLELKRCGSEAWTELTYWSGDRLGESFRSEVLPVAMLPPGLQRVRAVRTSEQVEAWVHPFDYPGNGTSLAASESLALAIRARDSARVASCLSPGIRFESCGDRIVPRLEADEFSTAIARFLDDAEMVDLAWSWRLTAIGEWSRDGKWFALVRADNLSWSFGRLSGPCEEPSYDWAQSGAGGGELVWSRAENGGWLLDRWTDHVSRESPALIDHLIAG